MDMKFGGADRKTRRVENVHTTNTSNGTVSCIGLCLHTIAAQVYDIVSKITTGFWIDWTWTGVVHQLKLDDPDPCVFHIGWFW